MPAYQDTNVTVERSQGELRKMLLRYGADQFAFFESGEYAEVAFRHGLLGVRMRVPISPPSEAEVRARAKSRRVGQDKAVAGRFEQEHKRVWRVLYWLLKTRMEAIEAGVETFEQAFLAHLLDPASDRTVYEAMVEQGAMRQLEAGGES